MGALSNAEVRRRGNRAKSRFAGMPRNGGCCYQPKHQLDLQLFLFPNVVDCRQSLAAFGAAGINESCLPQGAHS